jgi:hypothetical protein
VLEEGGDTTEVTRIEQVGVSVDERFDGMTHVSTRPSLDPWVKISGWT